MSLGHGSSIVTTDLTFYYDMFNKKSFAGAPATNDIVTVTWSGDGSNQTQFNIGSSLVTDETLKYRGLTTYLWSPGSSLNCYLNGADLGASTSTEWTFSCFIRREDNQPITALSVYMYYPASDGASAGTITDVGNGWYRVHRTRTGTANALTLVGFTGFSANVKYYISGAMLTKTQYPVYPVEPLLTRSATQSILDLTSRNTITANSLTYAQDETFTFNAAGNYISLPASVGYNTVFSVFAWVKILGAPRGGYHIVFGPADLEISIPTTGEIRTGVQTSNGRFVSNHGSGLTNGAWHYVGFTFDGTTKTSYIDGISVGTQAVTGVLVSSVPTRSIGIFGQGDATYGMNGMIGSAKIYNRSLSASEIRQNFNAQRGRFGI